MAWQPTKKTKTDLTDWLTAGSVRSFSIIFFTTITTTTLSAVVLLTQKYEIVCFVAQTITVYFKMGHNITVIF